MALKKRNRIKMGETVGTLTLTALPGDSLIVKDVAVIGPSTTPVFATITVRDRRVGYFRVAGLGGNHLGFHRAGAINPSLIRHLFMKEVFTGYPVAEGESFLVELDTGTGNILILYDEHDGGDFTPTAPNGSRSDQLTYVSYGTNLAALAVAGYTSIDDSRNPEPFVAFPFGADVPARARVEILGVVGQSVGRSANTVADRARSTHLRFIKDGDFLFDEDKIGRRFLGTDPVADGVDYASADQFLTAHDEIRQGALELFPEPLVNEAGTELLVEVCTEITAAAGTLAIGDIDVATVQRLTRTGA